jgi:hypothetical protein
MQRVAVLDGLAQTQESIIIPLRLGMMPHKHGSIPALICRNLGPGGHVFSGKVILTLTRIKME